MRKGQFSSVDLENTHVNNFYITEAVSVFKKIFICLGSISPTLRHKSRMYQHMELGIKGKIHLLYKFAPNFTSMRN